MSKKDVVVGLDIGTTKICAIVGEVVDQGPVPSINIVGIGTAPSTGLRKGVVVNIESTVESISKAVKEAELMAGCKISSVFVGIAGGHIKSFNSTGVVAVKDREVTRADVERVMDAARAVAIPLDREVIHMIPQEYLIDGQDGIRNPIGMSGVRLEVKVHIVTGAISAAQNLVKCANQAGLHVTEVCLQPIASSEAVLSADERELGVALIDIGGGTTDLAIFREGSIVASSVIAIGGNHLTSDISLGLRTPAHEAEQIKVRYGSALSATVNAEDTIEVPGVGDRNSRTIARRHLASIIEPRVEEIFLLIEQEIVKSGFHNLLTAGAVITGGSTLLEGMPELAENVLEMPVKRGIPSGIGGLRDVVSSPKFATGVGLVKMGAMRGNRPKLSMMDGSAYHKIRGTMKNWIRDLF